MKQTAGRYQKEITVRKQVNLDYLLHLPEDYYFEQEKAFPLVLFLHGVGERGNNAEFLKRNGLPKLAETQELPFILLSPQCPDYVPRYSNWLLELDAVMNLFEETIQKYRVDESRIYLTGLSMGGYGAWELAIQNPDRFAAVAPICGGGSAENVHRLKDIPVWTFHGAKDDIIPIEETEQMVAALKEAGGNVKFTVYPDAKHDSWTETYNNPQFFEWMLSQSKLHS
ncbi:phospholipase [Bacillus sp. V3-13]|uniref:carboxylesterase family protein n=1 Tax=Bacillus sp. V3-13 TaxID=2053728 RepID=UPI000C76FF77|nr:prolyl oligopeptidase family serine peptidase [Bacillus sp. V3-13]PLR77457.1 phospholipase [Bacillus sp. V3-13]